MLHRFLSAATLVSALSCRSVVSCLLHLVVLMFFSSAGLSWPSPASISTRALLSCLISSSLSILPWTSAVLTISFNIPVLHISSCACCLVPALAARHPLHPNCTTSLCLTRNGITSMGLACNWVRQRRVCSPALYFVVGWNSIFSPNSAISLFAVVPRAFSIGVLPSCSTEKLLMMVAAWFT